MRNLTLVRIFGSFRALVGSASKAMKSPNPNPPSAARTADDSAKIMDKFNQELGSFRIFLETMYMKVRRATEQGEFQQVLTGSGKLQVKQAEDSKLWQELDSTASASVTKTFCDQLTAHEKEEEKLIKEKAPVKTQHQMAQMKLRRATEQLNLSEGEHQHVVNGNEKLKVKQTRDSKLWQGLDSATSASVTKTFCDQLTAHEKEEDSIIKELEASIDMVQHLEVTENKLRRLDFEAETSSSNINWEGKLTYEDCEQELLQKFLKLDLDKQYESMLQVKKVELSKHLKELSLNNDQAINEIHKKQELEKIEITNAENKKAEKLIREIEKECNEKISENKQDSERYLMRLKEEYGTKVARIQQDKEHNEATLQAYLKEELQLIQPQAENELRERLSLDSKEHGLPLRKHEEESLMMQDELVLDNSKLLQRKGMGENRQIDQEVNSKKVAMKSLNFSLQQLRMASSNSIDERAPGNTATVYLDKDNIPASKLSYTKAMTKVVEWCKANTEVFDLSEHFGPGAEVFTTPAEGIFHLKFICRGRELTLFIRARDLYLLGWEGDRHGAFELQANQKMKTCIPGCKVLKVGLNYHDISNRPLGDTRIGPIAMFDAFEWLYKCDGTDYSDALNGVMIFAINTSEAIRDQEIFKEIEDCFDLFLRNLDSRWVEDSGIDPLSAHIRSYRYYSRQYLEYVDCLLRREPLPVILSREDKKVISIHELRNRIRVPLRDAYNCGKFLHEKRPDSTAWCPPYPDGKDWISDEEEEE